MRYTEGEWLAVAAPGGGALLPAGFGPDKALDVLQALQSGKGFSDVLQALIAATGGLLTGMPSFAIAVLEGADAHVAVRGPAAVSDGGIWLDGQGVTTWREERLPNIKSLRIGTAIGTQGAWWPIDGGIVRAGALELLAAPDEPPPVEVEPVKAKAESPAAHKAEPPAAHKAEPPAAPKAKAPAVKAEAPAPAVKAEAPVKVEAPAAKAEAPVVGTRHGAAVPDVSSGSTTLIEDEQAAADEDDEDEAEAKKPEDQAELHSTSFYADMFSDGDHDGRTSDSEPDFAKDDHDGLTKLSWAEKDDDVDHDGMTVLGFPDEKPPPPPPPPDTPAPAPVGGPTVLARTCRSCGTPNPTQRVACRGCGATLSGDAARIPRPLLGTLILPSGESLAIQHPVVLGRRPEVARFSGDDVPVVVKMDDPHISSTHLKIDLEDWSVLVTNMGLNGTVLRRPGQPDRKMGDGETVLAQAGDVYDMGSGALLGVRELV